ncbi:MAG TPA: hypothetical protein DHV36_14690 [Desulfobacteraceae bacterium]|nr:hypothetical protein [Desulfobacteraceae bacterium]
MNDRSLDFQSNNARTSVANIEQSRAISETQAAMIVAQKFPRDENVSYKKIMVACQRHSLAESGIYAFKRGNAMVTGPSIRLAEVLARCWGNMDYGFREVGRTDNSSEIEAFCWDMENNVRITRTFTVKHWRDTQGGGYALKQERDKYELVANQAQRRVRACILQTIPGDIVEAAEKECQKTLQGGDGRPIEDRVRDMLVAFQEFGVDEKMIEELLNHKIKAIIPAELVKLQQIYKSIKDGVAPREDFFKINEEKKTSKAADALSKTEKANPLHDTKDWKKYEEAKAMFPDIAATLPEPTTTEQCLEAVKTINQKADEENA